MYFKNHKKDLRVLLYCSIIDTNIKYTLHTYKERHVARRACNQYRLTNN